MGDVLYIPNLKKSVTGTVVGSANCADVFPRNDALNPLFVSSVAATGLDVVDFLDTPIVDATTINGSAGAFVQVVASLAAAVTKIQVMDTSGAFMGVFVGPAAGEVLKFIYGPGSDSSLDVSIPAGSRVSLRSMEAAAPTAGFIAIQFLG